MPVTKIVNLTGKNVNKSNIKNNRNENIKKYFTEYSEATGIHGIRYITEKRSITEKIFWIVTILISLASFLYMTYGILLKYHTDPLFVNVGSEQIPIFEIPFPTVTVCPFSKVSKQYFDYEAIVQKIENGDKLTEIEKKNFTLMETICHASNTGPVNFTDVELYSFLRNLDSGLFMDECRFMGNKKFNCQELFVPVLTSEGVCYSFNSLKGSEIFKKFSASPFKEYFQVKKSSQWNPEKGYHPTSGMNAYPYRALYSGVDNALEFRLSFNKPDAEYDCLNGSSNYFVLVNAPTEYPDTKNNIRIVTDSATAIVIEPQYMATSVNVQNYNPKIRQCYFQGEKLLKYFQYYNQENCNFECLTNFTLQYCKCVPFYAPRDKTMKVCRKNKRECVETAAGYMVSSSYTCNCLPLCTQLGYSLEISQSTYRWYDWYENSMPEEEFEKIKNDSKTILTFYFKTEQFFFTERNELYGAITLISNIGGLLGLFTGWTLMSIPEILYYLTLRIIYNQQIYGHWAGLKYQ